MLQSRLNMSTTQGKRLLCFLAAAALSGCGGGGGGATSSVSPSAPAGSPAPVATPETSSSINEGTLAENSLRLYSSQFSSVAAQASGNDSQEVYDPQTRSSLVDAFAKATLADPIASRGSSTYLIASSTYGIAQAARDLLAGIGVANSSYTFLDTAGEGVNNRSAYQKTSANSIVNILSNPLYTRRGSELVGGLIISPDDINKHGWIVSDTGFDGNIDPLAGITGRSWLVKHKADIEHGYRQAVATGKVRLFYGLSADGESRHSSANGCKGFENYCLGTPYSLRVKNAQGRYIDVEGAFVSTYGFAAYVLAWERMAADTSVAKVFELADACAHDLGEVGADADTGLGRLDVGCMASRIYAASVVVEDEEVPTVVAPTIPVPVVVSPVTKPVAPQPVTETVAITPVVPQPEENEVPETEPAVVIPVVEEPQPGNFWNQGASAQDINDEFSRLELTVTTSRKNNAYLVLYQHDENPSNFIDCSEVNYSFHCRYSGLVQLVEAWDLVFGESVDAMNHGGYNLLELVDDEPAINYDSTYTATGENSLIGFRINPFYLGNLNGATTSTWLNPANIADHGWIVAGTGLCLQGNTAECNWQQVIAQGDGDFADHRKKDVKEQSDEVAELLRKIRENSRLAAATGKVRLFYSLKYDQVNRDHIHMDCQDFEEYCIGLPNLNNDPVKYPDGLLTSPLYGFGLYLMAWERMPAETHISAVFNIGDRCVEDIGAPGPDSDTGLGRLDVGCMVHEVYRVNLDPTAATLSVVARKPGNISPARASLTVSVEPAFIPVHILTIYMPSAPQPVAPPPADSETETEADNEQQNNDPAQQQFFDDFAQDMFSDLGNLSLPGSTDASVEASFPGDSFQGRYRPAKDVQPHYHASLPQPGYAMVGGKFGVMGIGNGELGIFTRIEGIDVSFSYRRSDDFFGGSGSGQFAFDKVGNARLMLQRQLLPSSNEHGLLLAGWTRHATVTGSQGALLDDLTGQEYGASLRYDWQRDDGISVSATAWTSRFAGGEVGLAGEKFAIGASDWQWGVRMTGSYQF